MSSVKGFSGPASEKIKLFIIGHRRRSAFLMNAWTLAGTLRSVMLYCVLGPVCHCGKRVYYAKRDGLSGRAVAQRSSETLALGVRLVRSSNASAKVELGVMLVCYLTLAVAFGLFAFLEWIGAE